MSCPEDRVIAFLAGELSETEERRFDEHLLSCEACWRTVQADRAARLALEKLRQPAPAGLKDRVELAVALAADEPGPGHRVARPHRLLVAAACALVAVGAGTFGWLATQRQAADPPQVAAVAAMITQGSSPPEALRAGERMVVAGQPLVVRAYEVEGGETIVATSVRPFPVPPSSHWLSGSSSRAWMATKGRLSMYGVNRPGGEQSMFLVAAMPMAELPQVAARLHLI